MLGILQQHRGADSHTGVQAERDHLEHQIAACQRRLTISHSKQAELQRRRIALSTRHADAAVSLTALTSSTPATPPPPASCSGLESSTTAGVLRARLGRKDASPGPPHTSAAPAPSPATAPSRMHAGGPSTAVVSVTPRQHGTFYIPPGQNPWTEAPRPIGSLRHCAGISYTDLRSVAEGSSDLIDLCQQSVMSLIEKATLRKAQQMGVSGTGVPGDDICWFAEMPYEAAPGVPLSTSATISSPECIASLGVQIILTQLELALITAATDCMGNEGSEVIPSVTETEASRSGKDLAPPPARRTKTATASACALPALPRKRSQRRPSSHAQERSRLREGDSTVGGDGAEEGQLATEASAGPTRSGTWRWSGCIRCGVNETHAGRAAMRSIVRGLVGRFCGIIPSQTLLKLLHGYLLGLVRMLGTVGSQSPAQEMEPRSSGGIVEYVSKATVALHGAAQILWTEIADVSSTHVLQQLVWRDRIRSSVTCSCMQSSCVAQMLQLTCGLYKTMRATGNLICWSDCASGCSIVLCWLAFLFRSRITGGNRSVCHARTSATSVACVYRQQKRGQGGLGSGQPWSDKLTSHWWEMRW